LKVTSEQIAYWRFPFFSGCCLLSAWITPGDILLQLFGTLFGVLCFEMTLYFLIFVQTREEVFLSIKKH
jgi:Sec-independent protein secretion pathway component TatC